MTGVGMLTLFIFMQHPIPIQDMMQLKEPKEHIVLILIIKTILNLMVLISTMEVKAAAYNQIMVVIPGLRIEMESLHIVVLKILTLMDMVCGFVIAKL